MQKEPFNTEGWVYVLTYGNNLDIYAYGSLRIGIDRNTGIQKIGYVTPKGGTV